MASFTERVQVLIDVTGEKAASSLSTFKDKVGDAEGAFGKLKAGASGAFDMIGSLGPIAAAGAGAAIGKAVYGMVTDFEDLALSANDFAQASGLAVDDASRWMEVAGDVGVNVGTLEGAINKMNLAAGKGDLAKLGIEGETTNEQLLNSLTHLQAIPDASQRATEGVKIFGKSWTNLAPLVESSQNLKQALADVSSGQVIDQAEVEKAKEFRDAMDNLSDTWKNFALHVGEAAIGPITDTLELVKELGDAVGKLGEKAGGGKGGPDWWEVFGGNKIKDITGGLKQAADGSLSLADNMKGIGKATIGLVPGLGGWADENLTVKDTQEQATDATAAATAAAKAQADQAQATQDAIEALTNAVLASFNSQLAYEDAQGKTTKAINDYVAAAVDAGNAAGESTDLNDKYKASMNDAEQAALGQAAGAAKLAEDTAKAKGETITAAEKNAVMRQSLLDIVQTLGPNDPLRQHLMEYITQLGEVPPKVSTEAELDTSEAMKKLTALTRAYLSAPAYIFGGAPAPSAHGYNAPAGVGVSAQAAGGAPAPSSSTMVAGGVRAGQVVNVTYNAPPGVNPADMVRVLNRWTSTRGTPVTSGATGL